MCNVVPVIGKSDSLLPEERIDFKKRIKAELEFHAIRFYPFTDMDEEFYQVGTENEQTGKLSFKILKVKITFALRYLENIFKKHFF